MTPPVITWRATDIACVVGTKRLFSRINTSLTDGECLLLIGSNGSGKTTFLRAFAGLTQPTEGSFTSSVQIELSSQSLENWRDRVLYQGHLPGWKSEFSARENLGLQSELDQNGASSTQIDDALHRVGLSKLQLTLPFTRLSAGQKRRVALARLMLDQRCALWLLDEPTTALDQAGQQLFTELLDTYLARGGAAVVSTHLSVAIKAPCKTLQLGLTESKELDAHQ
jgi:heme exporter protein A